MQLSAPPAGSSPVRAGRPVEEPHASGRLHEAVGGVPRAPRQQQPETQRRNGDGRRSGDEAQTDPIPPQDRDPTSEPGGSRGRPPLSSCQDAGTRRPSRWRPVPATEPLQPILSEAADVTSAPAPAHASPSRFRVQSLSLHRASGTPAETDAAAVVAAVEAERPELPLAVAHPVNRARILVRVGIEDVLRLEQDAVGAQYATSPTSCRWLSTAGARRSCSCRPTRTRRRARSARGARSTRRCGPCFSLLAAPSRWSSWAVTRCDWRRPSGALDPWAATPPACTPRSSVRASSTPRAPAAGGRWRPQSLNLHTQSHLNHRSRSHKWRGVGRDARQQPGGPRTDPRSLPGTAPAPYLCGRLCLWQTPPGRRGETDDCDGPSSAARERDVRPDRPNVWLAGYLPHECAAASS